MHLASCCNVLQYVALHYAALYGLQQTAGVIVLSRFFPILVGAVVLKALLTNTPSIVPFAFVDDVFFVEFLYVFQG